MIRPDRRLFVRVAEPPQLPLDRLRLLADSLGQDVPGTDGCRWDGARRVGGSVELVRRARAGP